MTSIGGDRVACAADAQDRAGARRGRTARPAARCSGSARSARSRRRCPMTIESSAPSRQRAAAAAQPLRQHLPSPCAAPAASRPAAPPRRSAPRHRRRCRRPRSCPSCRSARRRGRRRRSARQHAAPAASRRSDEREHARGQVPESHRRALLAKRAWKSKRDVARRCRNERKIAATRPTPTPMPACRSPPATRWSARSPRWPRRPAAPGADADLGGFGGVFDLKAAGFDDPLLVAANDGVGTKLKLAIEHDRHDGRRHRPGRDVRQRPDRPGRRAAVLPRLLRQRRSSTTASPSAWSRRSPRAAGRPAAR